MTIQTPDTGRETPGFKLADQKIENLLKRLDDKRICPCCTARALAYHAASMASQTMGSAAAIEMFEKLIIHVRKHDIPGPDLLPSTAAH